MAEFKPNIYPIMYWALAFGVLTGIALYIVVLLGQYITVVWVPLFLVGMAFGAYRNYKIQKKAWSENNGVTLPTQSPLNEFKEAFRDIRDSSQELLRQQNQQNEAEEEILTQEQAEQEELVPESEVDLTQADTALEPEVDTTDTLPTVDDTNPNQPTPPTVPPTTPAV